MTCTSDALYTVQSGDTLYLLAERLLGDGNR
jgi:nucleoid-associated protein YgaU